MLCLFFSVSPSRRTDRDKRVAETRRRPPRTYFGGVRDQDARKVTRLTLRTPILVDTTGSNDRAGPNCNSVADLVSSICMDPLRVDCQTALPSYRGHADVARGSS